ncbi:MAG: DNA gyrase subunit A [Halobacteriovoraceae bacterium]|nr:DNA gyrase subunit A [Halobacteriovoraceae bacterium]
MTENTIGNDGTNPPSNVEPLAIKDEMKNCYLDYAMSVIIGRALPDVRDGLKPVHRRILYAMHMLNNYHNRPFLKSARVVGDVIGKYHPHGDSAVYNSIVRLAQDFSMRYQIVDGQGNFGSIDGDNAAAMRYTEIRMQKLAEELLKDIDKDTVEWQPNYDDSLKEPVVLPTKVPNLLINGSTGIAVGMATNIPPHNITEIMNGLIALIDTPELTISELMDIIPGPDFPTGGAIHGTAGIKQAYHTGKGVLQIRAKAEIEVYGKQDRERIIVNEIPYQVNKAKLIEKIASLVNNKELQGVSDIRDESNRLGIRVVIDIKKGAPATVILNRLYKQTQLQVSFGIIFLSIHNGQPKVMDLKEQLKCFIDHRKEVVVRRTRYELKRAKEKAHILEGLKVAVENIDVIVEMIKKAKGPDQAREQLMKNYELSQKQAQAILDMRLQRLTGLERDKIITDYNNIIAEIKRLEEILSDENKVKNIIKSEFTEILESYGDARKTEIIAMEDEINFEDMIKNEEVIVTTTHKGYVKRMAIDTYRAQKRGGKGVKGGNTNSDDDFYTNIFTADTHDTIMFFTDKGIVFNLKVYNIPEASRTAKGRNIINLIQLPKDQKVKSIVSMPKDLKDKFLIIATKSGLVKKTDLTEYERINQNGKKAIKILDGDEVVSVKVVSKGQDILLCSSSGKAIRFDETQCRPMGRTSQGVKGINISSNETVIGMIIVEENMEILSVTSKGFGKRTEEADFKKQSRGGKGIIAMKLTPKNGDIVEVKPVTEKDDLMIITDKGQVIRTKIAEISKVGRNTQGVRVIRLNSDESVVSVEKILESDDEDTENEE